MGPEMANHGFDDLVTVTNESTLAINTPLAFKDTLRLDNNSTVVIGQNGIVVFHQGSLLEMGDNTRLIVHGELHINGRVRKGHNAEIISSLETEETSPFAEELSFSVYPNPFAERLTLHYSLPSMSHVRLEVYNVMGQRVAMVTDALQPAGAHIIDWAAANIPSGVYYFRLTTSSGAFTRNALHVK